MPCKESYTVKSSCVLLYHLKLFTNTHTHFSKHNTLVIKQVCAVLIHVYM